MVVEIARVRMDAIGMACLQPSAKTFTHDNGNAWFRSPIGRPGEWVADKTNHHRDADLGNSYVFVKMRSRDRKWNRRPLEDINRKYRRPGAVEVHTGD